MPRRSARVVVGLAVLLALSGCTSTEAGFRLPNLSATDAAMALNLSSEIERSVQGSLEVESNGCFTWHSGDPDADGAWIVWPDDAVQDDDEVVLGSGARVGERDTMTVTAGMIPLEGLPHGGDEDSYFGSYGLFCDADDRGVLLVTEIQKP